MQYGQYRRFEKQYIKENLCPGFLCFIVPLSTRIYASGQVAVCLGTAQGLVKDCNC